MYSRLLVATLILLALALANPAAFAASSPRMRPYTGIGLAIFSSAVNSADQGLQLRLYDEPGLVRVGKLESSRLSGNDWIFGLKEESPPLIVSARKGEWLRVTHDEAGREAWLAPDSRVRFMQWEQYLKLKVSRLLPGLQPQYYQLQQLPGTGKPLATLTPKQLFKVIKVDNGWCLVMVGQAQIGWLRWQDEDGRLLMGFGP